METKNRIREFRKNLNLSQESLATTLSTTWQTVNRTERSTHDIPTHLLIKMSKIFNITTNTPAKRG